MVGWVVDGIDGNDHDDCYAWSYDTSTHFIILLLCFVNWGLLPPSWTHHTLYLQTTVLSGNVLEDRFNVRRWPRKEIERDIMSSAVRSSLFNFWSEWWLKVLFRVIWCARMSRATKNKFPRQNLLSNSAHLSVSTVFDVNGSHLVSSPTPPRMRWIEDFLLPHKRGFPHVDLCF